MFEISSDMTEYEDLASKIYIYDGYYGSMNEEVDVVEASDGFLGYKILYNKLHEKTPEQIASGEKLNEMLDELIKTPLDNKVLWEAGIRYK